MISRRNEIRELGNALAREPLFENDIKKVEETKIALPMAHLEREQAILEVMNNRMETSTENPKRTFPQSCFCSLQALPSPVVEVSYLLRKRLYALFPFEMCHSERHVGLC